MQTLSLSQLDMHSSVVLLLKSKKQCKEPNKQIVAATTKVMRPAAAAIGVV